MDRQDGETRKASNGSNATGLLPIITGNWGCGSNGGGDAQLKSMLQWMAASRAGAPSIIYYTAGASSVVKVGFQRSLLGVDFFGWLSLSFVLSLFRRDKLFCLSNISALMQRYTKPSFILFHKLKPAIHFNCSAIAHPMNNQVSFFYIQRITTNRKKREEEEEGEEKTLYNACPATPN